MRGMRLRECRYRFPLTSRRDALSRGVDGDVVGIRDDSEEASAAAVRRRARGSDHPEWRPSDISR
eukprot:14665-Pelagococcus_subviridis.AAC.2